MMATLDSVVGTRQVTAWKNGKAGKLESQEPDGY
jgi:hypothetical protein